MLLRFLKHSRLDLLWNRDKFAKDKSELLSGPDVIADRPYFLFAR
jgi:hypothetical protein